MSPTGATPVATLETPPERLIQERPPVIHGIETLNPPAVALGEREPGAQTPEQTESQPAEAPKPEVTTGTVLTAEERLKQDPELVEQFEKELAKRTAQAITAAQRKWDNEVLQKKLNADREQREQALLELAQRAKEGDEDALKELGKTTVAQVLKETSVSEAQKEFLGYWFSEVDKAISHVSGSDAELAQKLKINNFQSIPEWVDAVATTVSNVKIDAIKAEHAKELQRIASEQERLAEAKAAEIVAERRQNLPAADPTQPVAGGGTPRLWNSLTEAANLLADGKIPLSEYALARAWYEDGRLAAGDLGTI